MCMSWGLAVREHSVDGNISSKGEIKKTIQIFNCSKACRCERQW